MVPKVGDVVCLNPDLLKAINKDNRYLKEEAWKEIFVITRIGSFVSNEFIVRIESKNKTYELNVKSNGESNLSDYNEEYKEIQLFIPAN